jgi:hypothetical protein
MVPMDALTFLIATTMQRRSLAGATTEPRRNDRPPVRAGRERID